MHGKLSEVIMPIRNLGSLFLTGILAILPVLGQNSFGADDVIKNQIACAKSLGMTKRPFVTFKTQKPIGSSLDIQAVAYSADGKAVHLYVNEPGADGKARLKSVTLKSNKNPPFGSEEVFEIPTAQGKSAFFRLDAVKDPASKLDNGRPIGVNVKWVSDSKDSAIVKHYGFTPFSESSAAGESKEAGAALKAALEQEIKKYPVLAKIDLAEYKDYVDIRKRGDPAAARALEMKQIEYDRPGMLTEERQKIADARANAVLSAKRLKYHSDVYEKYHAQNPQTEVAKAFARDLEEYKADVIKWDKEAERLELSLNDALDYAKSEPKVTAYDDFRNCTGAGLDGLIKTTSADLESTLGQKFPARTRAQAAALAKGGGDKPGAAAAAAAAGAKASGP
jgi:hypothetical protein